MELANSTKRHGRHYESAEGVEKNLARISLMNVHSYALSEVSRCEIQTCHVAIFTNDLELSGPLSLADHPPINWNMPKEKSWNVRHNRFVMRS